MDVNNYPKVWVHLMISGLLQIEVGQPNSHHSKFFYVAGLWSGWSWRVFVYCCLWHHKNSMKMLTLQMLWIKSCTTLYKINQLPTLRETKALWRQEQKMAHCCEWIVSWGALFAGQWPSESDSTGWSPITVSTYCFKFNLQGIELWCFSCGVCNPDIQLPVYFISFLES